LLVEVKISSGDLIQESHATNFSSAGVYPKRFGHRDDDKCWWCGGTVSQTREHLFRHGSLWKDPQKVLWKAVGKATGWKVGRCRHVQISDLFSIEECDQAVMDFLAATDVGKFPPKLK
jgi:hypothetical protein